MNRKGFEKPIEIFVALFIILAVALVLLKLFQNQISEKQKELADVQQEQQAKERMEKVQLACAEKCTAASNNGCSLQSLASLCVYGSKNVLGDGQYADLNNNQRMDYDETFLAGVGVCEDRLYCFHMMDSCCARKLSASDCKLILKEYWGPGKTNLAPTDAEFQTMLASVAPPGACSGANLWSDLENWG